MSDLGKDVVSRRRERFLDRMSAWKRQYHGASLAAAVADAADGGG